MGYVVLQKGMETLPVERVKAAFQGVAGLTATDAMMMCKDSLGIIVRGLEREDAEQLQASLAAQGVEAEAVDHALLPVLPPLRHVMRVECSPEAVTIYDPLGQGFALGGKDIMMIAAGRVSMIEFKRTNAPAVMPDQSAMGVIDQVLFKNSGLMSQTSTRVAFPDPNYHTTEETHQKWVAEIVIKGGGLRYNLEGEAAGQLLFNYLGARRTQDVAENFKLLVQDICRCAPEAALNRGAYYLRENNATAFAYPTKGSFYDEMVWLLWRLGGENSRAA